MSSSDLRAKIKSGLAKAILATGSDTSDLIYKVSKSKTLSNSPLSPESSAETLILLPNALIKSYISSLVDGERIIAGDKQLVSDSDTQIKEGDVIRQGSTDFTVVFVETKAPTSDVLLYISQIRAK